MKPSRASGCVMRSFRSAFTRSSGTRPPFPMNSLARTPSGVLFLTASRRRSPVEIGTAFASLWMRPAWVPLPPPGGPKKASRTELVPPAADTARLHEALVVPHEEVRLDLLHH